MPNGLSGSKVAQELLTMAPELPVLLMTVTRM